MNGPQIDVDAARRMIRASVTGYELNACAVSLAGVELPAGVRESLQLDFARRCRELWPAQVERHRR